MSDQTDTTQTTPAEKAPPKEIIRGRMPIAVVALARFGSQSTTATKAAADALGTTVGKIDDIRKNRNFAYVTADFKPTEAQKADGIEWLKRHPVGADALIEELQNLPVATAEESAAFEQVRASARGQNAKTAEGEVAQAGGGNRRKKKEKPAEAGEVQNPPAADGDSLLS